MSDYLDQSGDEVKELFKDMAWAMRCFEDHDTTENALAFIASCEALAERVGWNPFSLSECDALQDAQRTVKLRAMTSARIASDQTKALSAIQAAFTKSP